MKVLLVPSQKVIKSLAQSKYNEQYDKTYHCYHYHYRINSVLLEFQLLVLSRTTDCSLLQNNISSSSYKVGCQSLKDSINESNTSSILTCTWDETQLAHDSTWSRPQVRSAVLRSPRGVQRGGVAHLVLMNPVNVQHLAYACVCCCLMWLGLSSCGRLDL